MFDVSQSTTLESKKANFKVIHCGQSYSINALRTSLISQEELMFDKNNR